MTSLGLERYTTRMVLISPMSGHLSWQWSFFFIWPILLNMQFEVFFLFGPYFVEWRNTWHLGQYFICLYFYVFVWNMERSGFGFYDVPCVLGYSMVPYGFWRIQMRMRLNLLTYYFSLSLSLFFFWANLEFAIALFSYIFGKYSTS